MLFAQLGTRARRVSAFIVATILMLAFVEGLAWIGGVTFVVPRLAFLFWIDDQTTFTYSEDEDDEHAWGEVLARLLNCRVANCGVGGYGTLRARRTDGHYVRDTGPASRST